MEAIIAGIKAKYSQQHIAEMSQDELQTEVMNEIMKEKQNRKLERTHETEPQPRQPVREQEP